MSSADSYDARVQAIKVYNQPILDDFRAWLEQSGLAEKTVRNHICHIYEKLEIYDRSQAVLYAVRKALIEL